MKPDPLDAAEIGKLLQANWANMAEYTRAIEAARDAQWEAMLAAQPAPTGNIVMDSYQQMAAMKAQPAPQQPYCWLYKDDTGDCQIFFVDPPEYSLALYRNPQKTYTSQERVQKDAENVQMVMRLTVQKHLLLEALKYHMEQTRPIQKSIDAIAAAEGVKP